VTNSSTFIQYFPITTSIAIVIGWGVISYQNSCLQTRKEIRARIDSIQDRVEQLERRAIKFHTTSYEAYLGQEIRISIQRIANEITLLQIAIPNDFSQEVRMLRQSMTLKNFDQSTHKPLQQNSRVISLIAEACENLTHKIDTAYTSKFHAPLHERIKASLDQK